MMSGKFMLAFAMAVALATVTFAQDAPDAVAASSSDGDIEAFKQMLGVNAKCIIDFANEERIKNDADCLKTELQITLKNPKNMKEWCALDLTCAQQNTFWACVEKKAGVSENMDDATIGVHIRNFIKIVDKDREQEIVDKLVKASKKCKSDNPCDKTAAAICILNQFINECYPEAKLPAGFGEHGGWEKNCGTNQQ